MRHEIFKRIICSLLVCSMLLIPGSFVFAEGETELIDTMKSATLVRRGNAPTIDQHRHVGLKKVVDELVQEGKLSREKAEEIEKFVQQKKVEHKNNYKEEKQNVRTIHRYGLVTELVNAKIINEAEAEAIRDKFREMKQKAFDEKLGVLVQKGTITQAQADKVKEYFEAARRDRIEQFKKMQNMTEEQRKAYFKEHKKDNFITKLVDDGVLTKEQAEELRKVLREGRKNKCKDR